MPRFAEVLGAACAGLVIASLAAWRFHCIGLGPDPDTDAYGHFVIARQLLETPLDVHIHWVWLPLHHVLLAAGVGLGATLDHVRHANAALSALTPLLLGWALARRRPRAGAAGEPLLPAVAACMAAAVPIAIANGTTGEPEPCFTLLLLGAAVLLERERFAAAAIALSALVLLRYEAWAVVASVALVLGVKGAQGRRLPRAALACVLGPALSIGAWALARRLGGAGWFDFLRLNQSFAEAARERLALPVGLVLEELGRALDEAPLAAWLLGALCLLGVVPSWRRAGPWFLVFPLAAAAFLLLGWITRSHLGLGRHWVCLVPFGAALAAQGLALVAQGLGRLWPPLAPYGFVLLALPVVGLQLDALGPPLRSWQERTVRALPDRREAGRFLRSWPAQTLILCDDAAAEVLSELDSSRFVRDYLGHDAVARVRRWSRGRDELLVLSLAPRLQSALPLGQVVYGDPGGDGLVGLWVHPGD